MSHANPGIHHVKLGDIVVTALNDGQFDADLAWITGVTAAEAEAQFRATFRVLPPRITLSCFLLRVGGKTVLVDAGGGGVFGHMLGAAKRHLATLGVTPDSISTVLVTHAHPDHVMGLLDAQGGAAYPNAEIVIHAAEPEYWFNKDIQAAAPDYAQDNFKHAHAGLGPYAGRTRLIRDGQEALPGMRALHLPGHTPGHTGWLISSGGSTLLIWGDVVHLPGLQFAHPAAGMAFDVDGELGRSTRARAFDMAATDKLLVAGMHLDFPTFGHVRRAGTGYGFEPMVWAPTDTGLFSAP